MHKMAGWQHVQVVSSPLTSCCYYLRAKHSALCIAFRRFGGPGVRGVRGAKVWRDVRGQGDKGTR